MASPVSRRRALRTPPRATRIKPAISYAESSSGDDFELEEEQSASEPETLRSTPQSRNKRPQQSQRSQQKRPRPSSSQGHEYNDEAQNRRPKRRKQSKHIFPKSKPSQSIVQLEGSGVIPPWQTLPYLILVQIFQYATYPLYEEHSFQPLPSGRWLLNVARLCRDFAEPAFTVLYSSPPLVPMVQAHRLVDLLMADPIPMAFKYRQKVESLRIDVGQVVAYTLPGSGHLDLYGLIKDLPRLTDLEFYHQKDMSPYRNLDDNVKWTYPESIFDALEYVDPAADPLRGDKTSACKLRSWRWSSRMGGKRFSIEIIPEIHLKPSFASLEKVAFINYQVPSLRKDEEDPEHEKVLAKAINALPNLKHLTFESSTLVNAKLLPMLPTGLRNLELINCWEIIADDFAAFLLTHGRQLRVLTLNHNQSLSLSFLPMLGPGCPNLQVFRMNLVYFNLHASYRDSEPQYDKLLQPDQIPVWPSTIQTIELIQLRKWETEAAEVFFQSLLDSAGSLLNLRHLTIQAILNIGWRDRASFRDKWVGSLNRVFKRVSNSPKPIFSLPRALEVLALPTAREKKELTEEAKEVVEAKRSSLRSRPSIADTTAVEEAPPTPTKYFPSHLQKGKAPEKEDRSPPARRSTRSAAQNLPSGKYAESSDSEPEVEIGYEVQLVPRAGNRQGRLERELGILKETAGKDSPLVTSPYETSSDDNVALKSKGKGKAKEVIQGMCETVEVRIDNLRPTENQVTEADFLDEERSGDDDWNGDDDDDGGYAW